MDLPLNKLCLKTEQSVWQRLCGGILRGAVGIIFEAVYKRMCSRELHFSDTGGGMWMGSGILYAEQKFGG